LVALLTTLIGALLGFFLPGWFCSVALRSRAPAASAFVISLLILFWGVFLLGLCGAPVCFGSVLVWLLAVTAIAALVARRAGRPGLRSPQPVAEAPGCDRIVLYAAAGIGALLFLRAYLQPLSGPDTKFRWNLLALRLLEHGHLRFYPPLTPEDFRVYFQVDGIPPLVSAAYFWLYAGAGAPVPECSSALILAQFCCICAVTFRFAEHLHGRGAGVRAVGILATAPLFFWAVSMGQETGLTALSLSAALYFVVSAEGPDDLRAMVLAGAAAALGALSREYGWAFLVCALGAAAARRCSLRALIVLAATAGLLAGPWYLRNWLVAGNPFYSNPVGSLFRVNPVLLGILDVYAQSAGFAHEPLSKLREAGALLARLAPIPVVAGLAAVAWRRRRSAALAVSAAVVALLWAYSVGKTMGGMLYSVRVLSPALVLGAVLGAGLLRQLERGRAHVERATCVCLALGCLIGGLQSLVLPSDLFRVAPENWLLYGFAPLPDLHGRLVDPVRSELCEAGTRRVLANEAYVYAALAESGVEAVPIWSPEVAFLFDRNEPPARLQERLRDLGIRHILFNISGAEIRYVEQFPFFAENKGGWQVLWQEWDYIFWRLPPAAKGLGAVPR